MIEITNYVRYDARNVSVNKIFICQIEVNFTQHKTLDQRRSKRNCNMTMIRVNWFPALCQIKLRPANYVGEIIKNNFISTVRPTDHTNPSRK